MGRSSTGWAMDRKTALAGTLAAAWVAGAMGWGLARAGDGAGLPAEAVQAKPKDGPRRPKELPEQAAKALGLSYGGGPKEVVDLYWPKGAVSAPAIVVVQGSGWTFGGKAGPDTVRAQLARWIPMGIAVAFVDYPMAPEASPWDQAHEVGGALALVQSEGAKRGIDPGGIVLVGHGSGAHLAALLAADPSIAKARGFKGALRAVVALDPTALDLSGRMRSGRSPALAEVFGSDEQAWEEASPLGRLAEDPGPVLLACSSARADGCAKARRFAAKAAKVGARGVVVLPVAMSRQDMGASLGVDIPYTEAVEEFLGKAGALPGRAGAAKWGGDEGRLDRDGRRP